MGNRVIKNVTTGTTTLSTHQTIYARDANGQVMAIYERTYDPNQPNNPGAHQCYMLASMITFAPAPCTWAYTYCGGNFQFGNDNSILVSTDYIKYPGLNETDCLTAFGAYVKYPAGVKINYTVDEQGNLTVTGLSGGTINVYDGSNSVVGTIDNVNIKSSLMFDHPEFLPKLSEWQIYGNESQGRFVSRYPEHDVKYLAGLSGDETNNIFSRNLGFKSYELKDHLGNVRTTVSDIKVADVGNTARGVAPYMADITSKNEYYPFGMQIPSRSENLSSQTKRYGFNGKENDDEVKGIKGSQQDYGMRIYDPRVSRFLSVDPLRNKYPELTSYQFASNTPIQAIDLDGKERSIVIYDFSSEKISKTKIDLPKAGPLGNGVLVQTNHGGIITYFYGNDIPNPNLISFKKAYEGVRLDKQGNHVGYLDSKDNPTIGYGHKIKKGESYKVGGTISEEQAQMLFNNDSKNIRSQADQYLSEYTLSDHQRSALYDASFNMGPGKMSQYNEDGEKFSGENFFLQFLGDGDAVGKRRYAENLLYSEGWYLHLDIIQNNNTKVTAEKIIKDANDSSTSKDDKTKTGGN